MNQAILNNIYHDILEISDKNRQKELWLGKSNKYVSSYIEVMCRLFDDNDFEGFLKKDVKTLNFSPKLIDELIKLKSMLNSYKEKDRDIEIIEDPEWQKVIDQAKIVIKMWDQEIKGSLPLKKLH